jgi:hypothetical protein
MEDNLVIGRSRKTIGQTTGKDMDFNGLSLDMMIHNRILCCCLTRIVILTDRNWFKLRMKKSIFIENMGLRGMVVVL